MARRQSFEDKAGVLGIVAFFAMIAGAVYGLGALLWLPLRRFEPGHPGRASAAVGVAGLIGGGFLLLAAALALPHDQLAEARAKADLVNSIAQVTAGRLPLVAPPAGLLLRRRETCHAHFAGAELYEDVSRVTYQGHHLSASIRIVPGLTLRPGVHKSEMIPVTSLDCVDIGELVVTSKRLLFLGDRRTYEFDLDKITAVTPYTDGFQIQRARKVNREIFRLPIHAARFVTLLVPRLAAETA